MNAKGIVKNMQTLSRRINVPLSKLVLAAGAAELIHGVIDECGDLDITTDAVTWKKLKRKYDTTVVGGTIELMPFVDLEADIHLSDDLRWLEADFINGVYVLRKELLIPFRKSIGRQKDFDRIELIKEKLNM